VNQSKAETIITRLLSNAADVRYGAVSVTAKIHDGRITDITYSTTENTRETENNAEKKET